MTRNKRELLDLEKSCWEAMKNHDARSIEALTGDEYVMVMEEGVSASPRKELAQMLTSDEFRVKSYNMEDAHTYHISDDVALVTYKVHNEFERNGTLEKRDAYNMSIWKRDGEDWRCVAGADTPASR